MLKAMNPMIVPIMAFTAHLFSLPQNHNITKSVTRTMPLREAMPLRRLNELRVSCGPMEQESSSLRPIIPAAAIGGRKRRRKGGREREGKREGGKE